MRSRNSYCNGTVHGQAEHPRVEGGHDVDPHRVGQLADVRGRRVVEPGHQHVLELKEAAHAALQVLGDALRLHGVVDGEHLAGVRVARGGLHSCGNEVTRKRCGKNQ